MSRLRFAFRNPEETMRKLLLPLSCVLAVAAAGCETGGDDPDAGTDAGPMLDDAGTDAGTDAGPPPVDAGPIVCDEPGSTLGESCFLDGDCNDGCFCNGLENCVEGTCVAGGDACDDEIECTTDSCDEDADECTNEADDSVCTGGGTCTEAFCSTVTGCTLRPISCDDDDSCTVDSCDPDEGCQHELRDLDGDGFADGRCEGGTDCNDDPATGFLVNPDATEICGNGRDDDCNRLSDISDPVCAPGNDTCGEAEMLAGPGTVSWNTSTLEDNLTTSCEGSLDSGPDAVFAFQLIERRDVRASVLLSGTDNAIEIRPLSGCDDSSQAIVCDDDFSGMPTVTARGLEPGDYAIVVNTEDPTSFDLRLEFLPSVVTGPVDYDVCDADTPDVSAGGTYRGAFDTLGDDYPTISCNSTSSGRTDGVYRLSLLTDQAVTLDGQAFTDIGTTSDLAVAIVTDCADTASTVACSLGSTLSVPTLPAGDYFVVVEPSSTSAVSYELDVALSAPTPPTPYDTCATAMDVTDTTATVDLSTLTNTGGLGCGGDVAPYRDAFFSVTLTETRDVEVTTTVGSVHLMSFATTCGEASTETLCRAGTPGITETFTALPAGTYTIGVAVPADTGTFDVTTTTSIP
ncbi:MAG TPA: hypothetical protein RMH99_18695 [Sandaracinaceae bacterium LLY-WYZ-13_1]|nr:hypothetical protein [Sandaracinaceae bacterium LLY-WYZ-13_1]